ncbi:MAG: hypothetical protein AAGB12_16875 [Pseudomonadota bacterium]
MSSNIELYRKGRLRKRLSEYDYATVLKGLFVGTKNPVDSNTEAMVKKAEELQQAVDSMEK